PQGSGFYTQHSSDSLYLYINLETNEYKFSEDQHDYVLDESKTKEPTGCTGIGELHYICSKCGQERTTYFITGHSDVTYECKFLTEINNCLAGVEVKGYCGKCKELVVHSEGNYHFDTGYLIDLGEAEICEDHSIKFRDCPCEQDRYLSYNLDYNGSAFHCDKCGLTIASVDESKMDGCLSTTTYTYTFYIHDIKVKEFKFDVVDTRHNYDQIEFEILNDGFGCNDGWKLNGHCKMCNQTVVEFGDMHRRFRIKNINLRDYGGQGVLSIDSCPCGLEYRIVENSFYSYYSTEKDFEGNRYYICDSSPSFIIKEEQTISNNGPYEIITHTFYIGYDRETGSYMDSFSVNQLR
ncbi:MAG: hypothetical protein K2H06_01095, partial [Anaeroplasmataceae bacterium]|nr:hypothetical protein [Anaeroplasmataceae bacterium]